MHFLASDASKGNRRPQGPENGSRGIVGTVGFLWGIAEALGTAWKIGGTMLGWFKRLFGSKRPTKKFYLWKIGEPDRPAGDKEIEQFESQLRQVSEGEGNVLVTHHAVSLHIIDIPAEDMFKVVPVDRPEGDAGRRVGFGSSS